MDAQTLLRTRRGGFSTLPLCTATDAVRPIGPELWTHMVGAVMTAPYDGWSKYSPHPQGGIPDDAQAKTRTFPGDNFPAV